MGAGSDSKKLAPRYAGRAYGHLYEESYHASAEVQVKAAFFAELFDALEIGSCVFGETQPHSGLSKMPLTLLVAGDLAAVGLPHGVVDAGQLRGIEVVLIEFAREGEQHVRGPILLNLRQRAEEGDGFFQPLGYRLLV